MIKKMDEIEKDLVTKKLNPETLKRHKAVSYTHLRAHETVLDLVCRLLLEKKKNQIPNTLIISTRRQITSYH